VVTDRRTLGALLVGAALLFGLAGWLRLAQLPQGDEPHYLAITQAMARYHSIDPTPVYEHRAYRSYYPDELGPHTVLTPDGRRLPFHNPGAPLLFLVPFLLLGRPGAQLVVLAASLLIVVNMYRLQRELGITTRYAGLTTALFMAGSPVYVYSSMLFVEPLGALLILYAARVALADRPTAGRVALAAAGLGCLPWIHGRFSGFTLILGLLLAVRVLRRNRRVLAALAPLAVIAAGFEVFNAVRYGTLSPTPGYGTGDGVLQLAPWRGLVFLALDARFGVLPNFPVLVFAFAGVASAVRRAPAWTHVVLLGTAVPYTLIISTYPNWDGGYAPPGRFLAVLVPLGCCYVARALQDIDHRYATTLAVLAGAGGFVLAFQSDVYPLERFHWVGVPRAIPAERIEAATGLPLHAVIPLAGQPGQWPLFALWGAFAAAVVTALWWAGRHHRGPAPAGQKGELLRMSRA
jgi:hypothetical protein